MKNQIPQDGQPSRESSISLEDESELLTRMRRPDIYSLDLPNTHTTENSSAPTQPSDDGTESSSLSEIRLGRYLTEEHYHERFLLGMHHLGVNMATVRRYLPEIIQNIDTEASQAEATRGTATECDERGCRGSTTTTTAASTPSDASPEPIRAHDDDEAASALTSLSSHDLASGLAGLSQTDMVLVKQRDAPTGSESHLIGSNTFEEDLEVGRILMRHGDRSHDRRNRWRVGKQPRVRKTIRLRKRSGELK